MYVVTFYSFKGGVGRTMALVNVGVELAQNGRRVLLVDFDLEAPGIETFNLPRPRDNTPGIIDYVLRYVETNEAPDVRDFIYECPQVGEGAGQLWVMPSGLDDRSYERRLHSIDWQDLYNSRSGYLLIEDLKAQWDSVLAPDYVLIDSRTGFTDEGGICTRQLPDAVVVMFFPTEQNLRGLKKVIADIRAEADVSGRRPIELHFVISNVPDLDDETKTLEGRLSRFKEGLGYDEAAATIHHNESLTFLDQIVFTRDHPRSRLTREYQELTRIVRGKNLADRDAALEQLRAFSRRPVREPLAEDRLEKIAELHADDAEVLDHLASIQSKQGRIPEAIKLLSNALKVGGENPHVLRKRAQLNWATEDSVATEADVTAALDNTDVGIEDLASLVLLLRRLGGDKLNQLPSCKAIQNASAAARSIIADQLMNNREELKIALALLSPVQSTKVAFIPTTLCLIGLSQFSKARELLEAITPNDKRTKISWAFNHAVALWGETGSAPLSEMNQVLELDELEGPRIPTANYFQCLAVASWTAGDRSRSMHFIRRAQEKIMASPAPEFSCWQYLTLPALRFYEDLDEMSRLIESGQNEFIPAFMRRSITMEAAS
jgi:MinD-like ATPase involved in chromosome partitioning or flagellar assembly